ncbi:MAG TPA: hypothetical protein VMS12_06210 [Thermoanaerobaculia bacterium]|nr:hypothetical protein [Thermoanaerobaculia bacterium]
MTVRFFPTREVRKSSLIEGFFSKHQVAYELVDPEVDAPHPWIRSVGDFPAVEVDGRLFINPNDDALRKILDLDPPTDLS